MIEDGLHEERAILLSKIGQHYEALREYVHELGDFPMAERYCLKHYDSEVIFLVISLIPFRLKKAEMFIYISCVCT
jgi:hypothetical protein